MKNINTDITFFSDIINVSENNNSYSLSNVCKTIPLVDVNFLNDKTLEISELNFLLSINATENINSPYHNDTDTPENTFFFDHTYNIRLRLTEPKSGQFIDLDTFSINPSLDNIKLCKNIFSKKYICKYQNAKVAIPPMGKNLCVLKVLVQHDLNGTGKKGYDWYVQSIHPIQLNLNTNH